MITIEDIMDLFHNLTPFDFNVSATFNFCNQKFRNFSRLTQVFLFPAAFTQKLDQTT